MALMVCHTDKADLVTGDKCLGYNPPEDLYETMFRLYLNLKPKGLIIVREVVSSGN